MQKFIIVLCDVNESGTDVVLDTFGPFNSWESADAWRCQATFEEGQYAIVALMNEPKVLLTGEYTEPAKYGC